LAIGGNGKDGSALASVEVFEPESGRWRSVASMQHGRYQHAAALLPDGSVIAIGGNRGTRRGSVVNTCERLRAIDQEWEPCAPMAESRLLHLAIPLARGDVFVVGGTSFGSPETYSPVTSDWQRTAPMGIGRHHPIALETSDGCVFICGGTRHGDGEFLKDAEKLDPNIGIWVSCASMVHARSQHTATRLQDGSILVTGGTAWDGGSLRRGTSLQLMQKTSL
jgi:hypothetical protein